MFALKSTQLNTVSQPKNKLCSNVLKNTPLAFLLYCEKINKKTYPV